MNSVFVADGGRFVPQRVARASWYEDALHGGAVGGLFAREIEAVDTARPMRVARLTVDILRPVRAVPLTVETRVVRPGRRVQVVESVMTSEDGEVARASALQIRTTDVEVPEHPRRTPPPPPEGLETLDRRVEGRVWFHTHAVEMRVAEGGFYEHEPATVWFRSTIPFLPDEPDSPLMRTMAAADFANGVSRVLSTAEYVFMNPDLTVHLHRDPVGEWIALRSRTDAEPTGIGLAQAELFDETGSVGHGLQSLYLDTWEAFGRTPPRGASEA